MRQLLDNLPNCSDVESPQVRLGERWRSSRWATLAVVLVSSLVVYLQVFLLPGTPRVATGDQAIYLHHATRMLEGEMIYRDYDHFTFPGTDVFYMVLFRAFGVRAWIPQAMLVVVGGLMAWLILLISRKLIRGATAYLPPLLFIALPFSSYLDATHHWYSLVATTAALSVVLEERTPMRLLWAGALVGIGMFFTQSMIVLTIGIALFLLWEHSRENQEWVGLLLQECSLFVGCIGTIFACMAFFVSRVGLKEIVYFTVVFPAKYYGADWFNNWHVYLTSRPHLHAWTTWFDVPAYALIHLIVPFVYLGCFVFYIARKETVSEALYRRIILINVAGLFLFFTVASAPAYNRLYAVSPAALVVLVWLIGASRRTQRALLPLAWITVAVIFVSRPLAAQLRWRCYLDLPTGRTAFFDPVVYEKCKWMAQRSHPSDYFFGDPLISYAFQLKSAARVPFLRPTEYTRPEEVADAIDGLENLGVRFVSWYAGLDHSRQAAIHPEGDHLAPMRSYLREHYRVVQTFANGDQIWERNQ